MKILKEEKGSITLFVLIAILFFAMYLVGMYMLSTSTEGSVIKETARIKEIYEQGVNNIDDVYSTVKNAQIKPYILEEIMGGANSPDISGFNVGTAYYVTWGTTAPYEANETTTIDKAPPRGWSNYNRKEWANIKTTGGENECYWVWIPRYAYCITDGYHTNTAGTIDIKFLKGTSNTPIDGSDITISNSSGFGNWNVHPAFWFDKNNNGIEDEGEQLRGIWVAKYEASSNSKEVVENPNTSQLATNGGGQNIDLQVRVKPNVTSWREININGMFDVCQNLTKTVTINGVQIKNSLADTTNLDSHMMKNTEWGAVAYLSRSVYGKNSEVWNNPYYTTNYSPITGLCAKASNGKDNTTTDITKAYKYNEDGGGNASTTGNVYGVYDMAGGAWEYVAGIHKGGQSNGNTSRLWEPNNLKYVDQYTETADLTGNYYGNTNKYGDAVYETSSSGNSHTGSWYSSFSYFPASSSPVFMRGGHSYDCSYADVFAFHDRAGGASNVNSFRPVVISTEP